MMTYIRYRLLLKPFLFTLLCFLCSKSVLANFLCLVYHLWVGSVLTRSVTHCRGVTCPGRLEYLCQWSEDLLCWSVVESEGRGGGSRLLSPSSWYSQIRSLRCTEPRWGCPVAPCFGSVWWGQGSWCSFHHLLELCYGLQRFLVSLFLYSDI